MNKEEFLTNLRKALSGLPQEDIEGRAAFYGEMIDDRVEEGLREEEAVAQVGSVDEIRSQIVADIPLAKLVREKISPKRRMRAWEIVLLVLGSPLWLALLISAAAILLSLYVVVWSLIISLWAIEISLCACALAGVAAAAFYAVCGNIAPAAAMFGAGVLCAGLAIFLFFGCLEATKGVARMTKKAALGLKARFIGKENAK